MNNFEYKVGDYVYCYKDSMYFKNSDFHKKDKIYKINNIIEYTFTKNIIVYLDGERNDPYCAYWVCFEIDVPNSKMFYDYFLSKEQYRKLKLEKLNG